MDENFKPQDNSNASANDTDLVSLVKKLQQHLSFLEKKIDTLITRVPETPFQGKRFSKPFRPGGYSRPYSPGPRGRGHSGERNFSQGGQGGYQGRSFDKSGGNGGQQNREFGPAKKRPFRNRPTDRH